MAGPFTNKVGEHYKYEPKDDSTIGVSWGSPFENHDVVDAIVGTSSKNPPTHGDHHSPYNYSRGWTNILDEQPMIARWSYYDWMWNVYKRHPSRGRPSHTYYSPTFGGDVANAQAQATTTAINNLQSNSASLGADLAEAVRMNDFVAETSGQAAKTILDFRRGNWKALADDFGLRGGIGKRTGALSRRWLELIYGIKPLMQSAHDTAGVLFDKSKSVPLIVKAKGSGGSSADHEYDDGGYHWTEKSTSSVKARIEATVTCPYITSLSQLGIINPASVAWELVPYSFVIDWFVPVGNFLTAWSAMAGMSFHLGSMFTKQRALIVGKQYPFAGEFFGQVTEEIQRGSYVAERIAVKREVFASAPLPQLYYKENPFSTTHVINALALIRQLY